MEFTIRDSKLSEGLKTFSNTRTTFSKVTNTNWRGSNKTPPTYQTKHHTFLERGDSKRGGVLKKQPGRWLNKAFAQSQLQRREKPLVLLLEEHFVSPLTYDFLSCKDTNWSWNIGRGKMTDFLKTDSSLEISAFPLPRSVFFLFFLLIKEKKLPYPKHK